MTAALLDLIKGAVRDGADGGVAVARFFAVLCCLSAVCGCARNYELARPPSFRPYDGETDVKMVTADGVMLKVREVDNYPKATLLFWTDAMGQHLERQGYALTSKDCFKTKSGLDGCSLRFLLPYGAEDWALMETLFVDDETLYLVEAAGEFERFSKIQAELDQAVRSFRLRK